MNRRSFFGAIAGSAAAACGLTAIARATKPQPCMVELRMPNSLLCGDRSKLDELARDILKTAEQSQRLSDEIEAIAEENFLNQKLRFFQTGSSNHGWYHRGLRQFFSPQGFHSTGAESASAPSA